MRFVLLMIYVALLSFLFGCQTHKLHNDPNIAAVAVGYPSIEFQACGNLYNGLGTCYLRKDQSLSLINLKIQGYYKGTGRVFSEACDVDQSFTYEDHALVSIKMPEGLVKRSCVFNMVLSPEYPNQYESGLEVFPLTGSLILRASHGEHIWRGEVRKVSGNWHSFLSLPLWSPTNRAYVGFFGCGRNYEQFFDAYNGLLEIPLELGVIKEPNTVCVADGAAMTDALWDYSFTVVIAQYATELPQVAKWQGMGFTPLAEPSISLSGNSISILGEEAVSLIGLNGLYVLGNKAVYHNFERGKKGSIRLVTVKGRTIVGEWEPLKQEFKWIK